MKGPLQSHTVTEKNEGRRAGATRHRGVALYAEPEEIHYVGFGYPLEKGEALRNADQPQAYGRSLNTNIPLAHQLSPASGFRADVLRQLLRGAACDLHIQVGQLFHQDRVL